MWVRFPSPALCASGSVGGARPCQGRGRGFESRLALSKKHKKMVSDWIPSFLCFRAPAGLEGSRSPLRSGRCKANVHWTFRSLRSTPVVVKRMSAGHSTTSRALKATRSNAKKQRKYTENLACFRYKDKNFAEKDKMLCFLSRL